jgi:hypothetical protein
MDTIINLTLGGQDRTLDFGCFWFSKHYQKYIKGKELTDAENLEAYIIAGLKAHYSKNRIKEDFSSEDVEGWVGDLSGEEVINLEKRVVDIITAPLGELQALEAGA